MLFDTHAHLDSTTYDEDRKEIIESLNARGVSLVLNSGADLKGCEDSIKLSKEYEFIYAAVGLHPSETQNMTDETIQIIKNMALENEKVVAIGEIGLDYHYDGDSPRDKQRYWFARQLKLAKELNMPVTIHSRDAHKDSYDILKENNVGDFGGVMHCFSGSYEMAKEYIKLGMYISFSGSVSFKSAKNLHEAAFKLPLDKLLIETDCPYLTPEPHRGKRNESGYVRHVAETIANIRGISWEEVANATKENGMSLYNIKK